MPEGIDTYRKALKRLAGRAVGLSPDQPRESTAQQRLAMRESDFLALPVDRAEWKPLQALSGDSFGEFFFLADFDAPDGDNPIR